VLRGASRLEQKARRPTNDEWVKASTSSVQDVIEGRLVQIGLRALELGNDVVNSTAVSPLTTRRPDSRHGKSGASSHGKGSGCPMAVSRWVSGDRFIETHVRVALGVVVYGWGELKITHQDYLRVRGVKGMYPGFSDDPIDGFRHVATDLAGPAQPVLLCAIVASSKCSSRLPPANRAEYCRSRQPPVHRLQRTSAAALSLLGRCVNHQVSQGIRQSTRQSARPVAPDARHRLAT
jgi:hypothetical protein